MTRIHEETPDPTSAPPEPAPPAHWYIWGPGDERLVSSTVLPVLLCKLPTLAEQAADMVGPVCVIACFAAARELGEPLQVQLTGDSPAPATAAEYGALLDSLPPGTTILWYRGGAGV